MLIQNILHLGLSVALINDTQLFNQYDNCENLHLILTPDC
jgi:hypothetical protein